MRAALAALASLAVAAVLSSAAPARHRDCLPGSRDVAVRSTDGLRLAGVVVGSGDIGVVLAHQLAGDLCQWAPFARTLVAEGYRVLAFDFRGHGLSPRRALASVDRDVAGAAVALRRLGARKIVLVGASMGGTAVLAAGPKIEPAVAAVVSLSAPAAFGTMDALAAVRRLRAPTLVAAADGDVPFDRAARNLAAAAAGRPTRLAILPGFEHGVFLLEDAKARRLVLDFLRRHARP